MSLSFTNWRSLDRPAATGTLAASFVEAVRLARGLELDAAPAEGKSLRRPEALTPDERAQMVASVRVLAAVEDGVPLAYDELFTARLTEVDQTGGFDEDFAAAPIEWWDVVDEHGHVRYVLWLLGSGCGKLIDASTGAFVGYIDSFDLCPEVEPNPSPDLWRALAAAQRDVRRRHPDSELAEVAVPVE